MIKKRIIALTIAMTMGIACMPIADEVNSNPVSKKGVDLYHKESTISEERAKEVSKDFLESSLGIKIDENFKVSASLKQLNVYGEKIYNWNVYMYKNGYGSMEKYSITIDGKTAEVKGVDNYNNKNQGSISLLNYREAKTKAEEFLKKVNKERFSKCKPLSCNWDGQSGNTDYDFTVVRMENGIEFPENHLQVSIDGITGNVIGYQCVWNDKLLFPKVDKIISREDANKVLNKQVKTQLKYVGFSNKYEYEELKDKKNIDLVYEKDSTDNHVIDAITGKKPIWEKQIEYKTKNITLENKKEYFKNFKQVTKTKDPCTDKEAIKAAEAYIKDNYKGEFELNRVNYRAYENEKVYSISYSEKNSKKETNEKNEIYINIDAQTKQIEHVNMYYGEGTEYKEEFDQVITWEQGFNKALDIIAKYQSDKIKNVSYDQNLNQYVNSEGKIDKERNYYYIFPRIENGIKFDDNYISVTLDSKTGEITDISKRWYDYATFDKPEDLYKEKDLLDKIKENHYSNLKYVYVDTNDHIEDYDMQLKLVYEYKNNYSRSYRYYDAFKGSLLDYSGEEAIENIDEFKRQIENSKVKKELEILAYNGYIDINNFDINRQVKNKDLIKILVDSLGYRRYIVDEGMKTNDLKEDKGGDIHNAGNYMSKEEYLKMAKYYGLIDNTMDMMNPEKDVTREELSRTLVNMLQYDIVAKTEGIFKTGFKDENKISKENLGYVAISKGLGIVGGHGDSFKPEEVIDYEELYSSIYRSLLYKNPVYRVVRPWEVR